MESLHSWDTCCCLLVFGNIKYKNYARDQPKNMSENLVSSQEMSGGKRSLFLSGRTEKAAKHQEDGAV